MNENKQHTGPQTQHNPELGQHPIQVVARRTGLTAEAIRMWEKRYGAVIPARTSSGRRMYSERDLEKLLLLREATLAGRRISEVAALPVAELRNMVREDVRSTPPRAIAPAPGDRLQTESFVQECLVAVRELDSDRLQSQIMRAFTSLSGDSLVDEVLAPLFRQIGEEWEAGTMDPYQEHLATSVVRTVLMHVLYAQQSRGQTIVLATPSGQHHEIGLMLAAIIAASSGWRVVYLGPDLPAEDIAKAVNQSKSRVLALSLLYPTEGSGLKRELTRLGRLLPPGTAVLAGGQGLDAYATALGKIGAVTLSDYQELRDALGHAARQENPARLEPGGAP